MNFISQIENIILLKNINDSNNISLNKTNIMFNPDIDNRFLESHLSNSWDSINKKILWKLKFKNDELSQVFMEDLINNNINLGNISSIDKNKMKNKSREESPKSQRDDEFDLTLFNTTIEGKVSPSISKVKNIIDNTKHVK